MLRQSQSAQPAVSGLRRRWQQVAGGNQAREIRPLVGAIAKRLVVGVATTTKRDRFAPSQAESLAFLIDNFEIAFDANRSVAENGHFGCGQESLQLGTSVWSRITFSQ